MSYLLKTSYLQRSEIEEIEIEEHMVLCLLHFLSLHSVAFAFLLVLVRGAESQQTSGCAPVLTMQSTCK